MRWNCLVTGFTLALLSGIAWGQEVLPETGRDTTAPAELILLNAEEQGADAPIDSQPLDTTNLFGGRTGYIHPFLSISEFYNSNLFLTADNEQSDRYTLITPGLWLALPASNRRFPEIGTSNTAPGGLSLSRFTAARERRVQGYALYQANILKYDRYQDEDRVDHRVQGMLKFSTRSRLSLELVDVFERNSDPYGTGGTADDRTLDTFDANLFNAILVSRLSAKMLLRADYGHYTLKYADANNSYRDRNDDSYSGYLFFQSTPKTAIFVQAEYITIDYDEENKIDPRHNNYYLGIQMQTSANTRGRVKVGYGMQDYGTSEDESYLAEVQLDYFFTPKTSFYLQGTRRILEPDVDQTGVQNILSHRALLGYRQQMTARWRGDASLFINRNDYNGTVIIGDRITTDYYLDEFGGRASLGFSPLTWLGFTLGYEYRERDSNFDSDDYRNNTVFLQASAAL